jgi:hypothetical protein
MAHGGGRGGRGGGCGSGTYGGPYYGPRGSVARRAIGRGALPLLSRFYEGAGGYPFPWGYADETWSMTLQIDPYTGQLRWVRVPPWVAPLSALPL